MGKKSRRSNRKGGPVLYGSNLPMISRRILKLDKEARESFENMLWSKAAQKYQESLEVLQTIQERFLKDGGSIEFPAIEEKAALNTTALISAEYRCCRFDKVVQIYNDIRMSPENEKKMLPFASRLLGQLAMLRLDASNENKERVVSLINTRISEGLNDPHETMTFLEAVMILRNLKEYDAAIVLGEKLGRNENEDIAISENSIQQHYRDITTFENTLTHLERYRVEYHSQPDKVSHNNSLHRVLEALNKFDDVSRESVFRNRDAYSMMMAQKDYLCHQVDDKELSSQLCSNAIEYVETYLETICHHERHCQTCLQAEVQLVCSGCRVARYCSLDHQRMTWKKDAIGGMRIGHEILCPLMNAYRKWKLVSKKGDQKALKLRRRLDRECLYFLSHGLGLKHKCFREEDVRKYFSL